MSSNLLTSRARFAWAANLCTKRAWVLALALAAGLLMPQMAQAQPLNDDCGFATFVTGSNVVVAGTTNGASGVDESSCGTSDVNDVWYLWTAPCSGPVTVSLCTGTTLADTTLSVFEGSCPEFGGPQIACNDNFCAQQSELSFNSTAFFTYLIRVAGVNATTGDFTLSIACPPTGGCCTAPGEFGCQELSQADCDASFGTYLGDDTTCQPDSCSTSACCNTDGSCLTIMYDQFGLPVGPSCNPPSLDLGAGTDCEEITCPSFGACCIGAQQCLIQTREDCEAVVGQLYLGDGTDCTNNPCATGACCDPSTEPLCINLDPFSCGLPATYLGDGTDCASSGCPGFGACCTGGGVCQILSQTDCANFGGNYLGDQTSCALEPCATGACCDLFNGGCMDLSEGDCALVPDGFYQGDGNPCDGAPCPGAGDDCLAAIIVQSGVLFMGDSTDATGTNESSCAGTGDTNDIWHRWMADCTGTVTVDTNGSGFDTSLSVFTGCGGTEIECDDDGGDGLQSLLTFDAVEGTEYRIRVAGFGGATGMYNLLITCPPEGACCVGNGVCEIQSPEGCALVGGFFVGVDSACTPSLCSTGGCCFSDGSCMDGMDQTSCEDDGGLYNGDGTSCPSGGVGPGTFTAVLDDTFGDGWNGSTLDIFVNGVSATGGPITFLGGDGDPAGFQLIVEFDVPAANSIITTSYTTGTFEAENTWEIRDQFGTPICSDGPNPDPTPLRSCAGMGLGCPPTGACCTGPIGGPFVCTIDFEDACIAGGGTFLGAGTNCDPAPNGGDRCDCNGNGEIDSADLEFGSPGPVQMATSTDTPIFVVDDGSVFTSTITLPATAGVVSDVNVTLNATHPYITDLDFFLSHNGVEIPLFVMNCEGETNMGITLDDAGPPLVCPGLGLFLGGTFAPDSPLSAFNGLPVDGDWTITVSDNFPGLDEGTFDNWTIEVIPGGEPVGTDCNGNTILDECEVPDPTTVGACCQLDGLCTIQTPVDCDAANGLYNGDCTTCDEVTCPAFGGCCLQPSPGVVTCELRFADACLAQGGVYLGNNSDCLPLPGTDDRCDCNDNGEIDGTEIGGGTFASTDTPIAIPDGPGGTIMSVINVGAGDTITDLDVGLVFTHTFIADLEVTLEHNGVSVDIWFDNCGGDDNMNVILDDDASPPDCAGAGPVEGTFSPDNPLAAFNGMSAAGTWTLTVVDDAGLDTGTLDEWSLILVTDSPGGGSDCDGNGVLDECQTPDPSQTGACCLTNGTCIDTSPSDCDTQGGLFQGGCTTCFEVTCDPVGACCTGPAPFTCSITFRDLCEMGGGTYLGDSSNCTPLPPTTDRCDCNDNDIVDQDEIAGGTFNSTDTPIAIPDVSTITSVINVGSGGSISDVNVGLVFTHTFIADLEITLEHEGVSVDIWFDNCGGDNNMDVILDDSAPAPPADCPEPVVGTFAPDNPLAAFNGLSPGGVWTLTVTDDAGADTGSLDAWSLIITTTGSGLGSDCDNNGVLDECQVPDPSLTGGCCVGASCSIELETDCTTLGGNFLGGCSDCSQPCPGVEACCFADGSCQDILFFDCVGMGGVAQGANTTCGTIICPPPPAENDECDASIVEIFDGSTAVDLSTATTSGQAACGDFPFGTDTINNDLWFSYTATCTGTLFVDTCGTADDTRLAVYSADCAGILGGALPLECNDDHGNAAEGDNGNTCPAALSAALSVPGIIQGNTYIIRVGSFSATTPAPLGIFNVNIGCFAAGGPEACCFPDGSCQDLEPDPCINGGGLLQGFGTQCATTTCPQPPAENDECDASIVEVFDGSTPVDLADATNSGPLACGDFPFGNQEINNDLWFEYTASCTGTLFIDTCGTADDTRLAVYDVNCAAILGGTPPIECNDDHGNATEGDTGNTCGAALSASLSIPGAVQGNTYIIRVGSFSTTTPAPLGVFNLNVVCASAGGPEACCFDDGSCQDLEPGVCAAGGGAPQGLGTICATTSCPQPPPPGDECDANILTVFDGSTPVDLADFTSSGDPACGDFPVGNDEVNNDVWFEYTATCTGTLFVDTCGTADDTRLAVYDVDCAAIAGGALPVECNDDHGSAAENDTGNACADTLSASLSLPVVQGNTYIIRVGSFSATTPAPTGVFNLNINCMGESTGCDLLGDLNDDTLVDGTDIQGFIDCVLGGGTNCVCADYDEMNGADLDDIGPFVADLLGITFVPCSCRGDTNGDGLVNGADVGDFTSCLILGVGAECGCANLDGMGGIDDADVDLFVEAVLNGPGCAPAP